MRVIEFLNEQMSSAEVLGVEVSQYVGGEHTVYVPRVVGNTSVAAAVKSPARASRWDEESFLAAVASRCTPVEVSLVDRLMNDARERGVGLVWVRGPTPGVAGWYSLHGRPTGVWGLNAGASPPSGRAYVVLNLADLVNHIGTDRIEAAGSVLDRIPTIAGKIAVARASSWRKYPSLYLADVATNPVHVETLVEGIRILTGPMAFATGGAP